MISCTAAQQFIWKHQIDQGALQTIAEFIQKNAGVSNDAMPAIGNADPLTRTREVPDVLPVRQYVLFTTGKSAPIIAKVCESGEKNYIYIYIYIIQNTHSHSFVQG